MVALNFLYVVAQPLILPHPQSLILPHPQPKPHGECCWLKANGACAQYTKTGRCRGRPPNL
jgi:hypothetical protein